MPRLDENLIYKIGLSILDGVGPINARRLVAYCGGAEAVFRENEHSLMAIPQIGRIGARKIIQSDVLDRAAAEVAFIEKHKIDARFYLDEAYPERLRHCVDAPVMLYSKGNLDLNHQRVLSVVGTRKASPYGIAQCEKLIRELIPYNPIIVSGLAYGIDICAHRAALRNGLPTAGVLAHGLDRIYPWSHKDTAKEMIRQGGLVTEFPSETNPDRENFPKRNRIIAGLCDAVIVIESGLKGGSVITAEIANSYHRDVFAIPGRLTDEFSQGCNRLVKTHKAVVLESVKDIEYLLGWDRQETRSKGLFEVSADPDENGRLLNCLASLEASNLEHLSQEMSLSKEEVHQMLMELEFAGKVRILPGHQYALV